MMHLREISFKKEKIENINTYPFNIPLIRSLDNIELESPITILVGENGSGKSTLLEALACAVGSITVGAKSVNTDESLEHGRALAKYIRLSWSKRTRKGFFMRAEDFINYTRQLSVVKRDMEIELEEAEWDYKDSSVLAQNLAKLPYLRSLDELESKYNGDLECKSHGESFLELFQARFVPGGLYIIDEPETPLSPMNQYKFMAMVKEMTRQTCQFIIATHSPIIMALPGAIIYDLNSLPMMKVEYHDVEAVQFTKSFLNNPDRFIRYME